MGRGRAVLERLHAATGVRTPHLALPVEDDARLDGFRAANDAYLRVGADLGEQAVRRALARAGLNAEDVDLILTVSVTGIAAPSLDTRIAPRLGLRPDVNACRSSGSAAWPGQRASPGCPISSAGTPTESPSCSPSSCVR